MRAKPEQDGGSDVEVTADDVAFFREHADFSSFLTHLDPKHLSKPKKKAKKDDDGIEFDEQPRHFDSKDDKNADKLPVKNHDGRWTNQAALNNSSDEDDSDLEFGDAALDAAESDQSDAEEAKVQRAHEAADRTVVSAPIDFHDKKEALANLASAIVEDPENNIQKLKALRQYHSDSDVRIVKLALLTQLAVYKDIIPGYGIRDLTEKEKTVKLSKEVLKLRNYEETLLSNYQAYVQHLEMVLKTNSPPKDSKATTGKKPDYNLLVIALRCLAGLLESVGHFNFRVNIMTSLVSRMSLTLPVSTKGPRSPSLPKPDAPSTLCIEAIEKLFSDSTIGDNALEAVKLISKLIKNKGFHVNPRILDAFLKLNLDIERSDKDSGERVRPPPKKKQGHISKKQKKKFKVQEEVQRELKEAEATVSKEETRKLHTAILEHIFVTYFRILKQAPTSILLRSVLRGVAKFGHQISIDYFDDLISVLRSILNTHGAELSLVDSLQCVVTAFTLLSGQGQALTIDLKEFYEFGYALLIDVPSRALRTNTSEEDTVDLVVGMIQMMFNKRGVQHIPAVRAAAFVKRLASLTLHLSSPACVLAVLDCIRTMLVRAPAKVHQLLEHDEQQSGGTTVYLPELQTPDQCNPFATGLWELTVLAHHWHPTVRAWIGHYVKGEFRHLINPGSQQQFLAPFFPISVTPEMIRQRFDWADATSFNPALRTLAAKPKAKKGVVVPCAISLVDDDGSRPVPDVASGIAQSAEMRQLRRERDELEHQLILHQVYRKTNRK